MNAVKKEKFKIFPTNERKKKKKKRKRLPAG
jgi:hypothetical protein